MRLESARAFKIRPPHEIRSSCAQVKELQMLTERRSARHLGDCRVTVRISISFKSLNELCTNMRRWMERQERERERERASSNERRGESLFIVHAFLNSRAPGSNEYTKLNLRVTSKKGRRAGQTDKLDASV